MQTYRQIHCRHIASLTHAKALVTTLAGHHVVHCGLDNPVLSALLEVFSLNAEALHCKERGTVSVQVVSIVVAWCCVHADRRLVQVIDMTHVEHNRTHINNIDIVTYPLAREQ